MTKQAQAAQERGEAMDTNARLAPLVLDALNQHLNARRCLIILGRRILMPRGLLWQILASLECNGMESNKKVLIFIGFICERAASGERSEASDDYPRSSS